MQKLSISMQKIMQKSDTSIQKNAHIGMRTNTRLAAYFQLL